MLGFLIPGQAKIAMYLGIALVVASAIGYHFYKVNKLNTELGVTRIDLVTSQANEASLQGAVDDLKQSQVILTQQREIDQAKMNELSRNYQASRKKVGELRQLLSRHDLGNLMLQKPGLIQNRMNNATTRLGVDFETLTASEGDTDE